MDLSNIMNAIPVDIGFNVQHDNILKIWASNMQPRISRIMRLYDITIQHRSTPILFTFAKMFIMHFISHGISKSDVTKLSQQLYRGVGSDVDHHKLHDDSFISTSTRKDVACRFAERRDSGVVLTIDTSELPNNSSYILIDETVNEWFHEDEIVLLPGWLTITSKSTNLSYIENTSLVQQYLNTDFPKLAGTMEQSGGALKTVKRPDIAGKIIIIYRAIDGRAVDIFRAMRVPVERNALQKFMRETLKPMVYYYDNMTDYIPEFMDLKTYITDPAHQGHRGLRKKQHKMLSYLPNTAMYDPVTSTLTRIGAVSDAIHNECCDKTNQPEVLDAVRQYVANHPIVLTHIWS